MFKFVVFVALLAASVTAFVPRLDGRIIGGRPTQIENYPYQISLQIFGSHGCGGSIIGNRWIVTAAHCTDGTPASYFTIVAGVTSLEGGGLSVKVTKIHQHPNFSMSNLDYDVSILELANPLTYNSRIQPIALVTSGSDPASGTNAVVTGWGTTREGGSLPDILQEVDIRIIDRQTCNGPYGGKISQRMLCAGADGRDACQGDSGGPLAANNQLVGVVSWGYGCARPNVPGVYASVGELREFIRQKSGI